MGKVNRNHKDSLFRMIFGDDKENALALYNAINGTEYEDASLITITTLKDAYSGEGDVEVIAHMININKGNNQHLLDKCKPLADYAEVISRVRSNQANGMDLENAIDGALNSCIKDGILEEILRKERAKVARALYEGISVEELEMLRQKEKEIAVKEAREEGFEHGRNLMRKLYHAMKKDNRIEDYLKAVEDCELQKDYLKEYDIY